MEYFACLVLCLLIPQTLGSWSLHWTRKSMKFSSHNSTKYHLLALSRVNALKSAIEKPGSSIGSIIRQTSSAEIVKNRFIIKSLTEAVFVLQEAMHCTQGAQR